MKLEYLDWVNNYKDKIVRLYDFDSTEACLLRDAINNTIVKEHHNLELSKTSYIDAVNCSLTLSITDSDEGIFKKGPASFVCNLSVEGYKNMATLLEPFCTAASSDYQWLYHSNTPIDLLLSPDGEW